MWLQLLCFPLEPLNPDHRSTNLEMIPTYKLMDVPVAPRLSGYFILPLASKCRLGSSRVENRVLQGGHNVPQPVIRRRFSSDIQNLFKLYMPNLDSWWFYDASCLPPKIVAQKEEGRIQLTNSELFNQIKQNIEG